MLSLHGEPGGVKGEDFYHTNEAIVRGDMEDRHADMQEACGKFLLF